MKINPKDAAIAIAVLAGTGLVVYTAWKVKQGAEAVSDAVGEVITEDLNPVSDQNLAYRGVNAIGAAISGDDSFSLGSWIYEITH